MFPLLGWGSRLQESLPREGLLCESKLKLPPSLLPGQPPQRPVTRPAALLRLRTDRDLCTFTPALQGPSWMPTTCHAAGTGLWERVLDKTHRILTAGSIKRKQMTVNPGLAPRALLTLFHPLPSGGGPGGGSEPSVALGDAENRKCAPLPRLEGFSSHRLLPRPHLPLPSSLS